MGNRMLAKNKTQAHGEWSMTQKQGRVDNKAKPQ
jgi:hypothetical protein